MRLAISVHFRLPESKTELEKWDMKCEHFFGRLKGYIKNASHLGRATHWLAGKIHELPKESEWRQALTETRHDHKSFERTADSEIYENPRAFLFKIIEHGAKNEREEKILNGAVRIYGEKPLWDAYEAYKLHHKDTLPMGMGQETFITKSFKEETEH